MSPRTIPVLLYHSVSEGCDPRFAEWAVSPERFAAHMAALASDGHTALTVRDLMARAPEALPNRVVAVTFDDGFADLHEAAWPALRAHGLTATVFLSTGYVGRTSAWLRGLGEDRRPMLSWEQIEELAADGIECAAHGHAHLQLDTVSRARAWADITASRDVLEEVVGPVVSFAYPHGYYTRRLQRQVALAGFRSACGVKHALGAPGDDRFALARIIVRGGTGVDELRAFLRGDGLPVAPRDPVLRRAAWRTVRRGLEVRHGSVPVPARA